MSEYITHVSTSCHSQHAGDDTDVPHVAGRCNDVITSYFRRRKLWRCILDVQLTRRVVVTRKAEIDDLQLFRGRTE